jgi:hypothetical protein
LVIVQRELKRALACLRLEENKNRKLPKLEPMANEEEYQRCYNEAANYLIEFLRKEEIFTVPDDMVPGPRIESFIPPSGVRDFFKQVDYRDPLPLRCHGYAFDAFREERNHHPIRGVPRLYCIDAYRAEGLATGMEEMMMHAGLLDKRPRTRELVYVLLANRAARAVADLKMHSNEFTLEEAVKFCLEWTPRGWQYSWKAEEGRGIWFDMQLYLRQPGYGMSYVGGKVQIDKLLADRAYQLSEKFSLKQFMDEFHAAGMIPIALTRWEMTDLDDEIKKLW